mmetsp:Transcript_5920/g.8619  ORF Transcript_5920/g.8619 Transcript_5920/m.8619 type:complete len:224 (-) Transcript_5920:1213-1884(-)
MTASNNGEILLAAAQSGDIHLLQDVIKRRALQTRQDVDHIVNETNAYGWTVLHGASERGHAHIVNHLLKEHACDPNVQSMHGWTPLHRAAEHGHVDTISLLLQESKCKPNLVDHLGETALHLASRKGYCRAVEILLNHGKANPNIRNKSGKTALQWAVQFGYETVVSVLLPVTKSPSARYLIDNSCRTPLSISRGRENRKNVVRQLLIARLEEKTTTTTGWKK